jgi:hypothetical protein
VDDSPVNKLYNIGVERRRMVGRLAALDNQLPDLLKEIRSMGVPVPVMASILGVTRQRIYQIMEKQSA